MLNGKYVLETAKRVCDFISSHDELINITTFGEYRNVMKNVMSVMKETHNTERKRRWAVKNEKSEERRTRTKRAKALIPQIKRGEMRKEDILGRVELIRKREQARSRRRNNYREDHRENGRDDKKRRGV